MKFKKTKLTALAMSVLMAASTITSVTWAADLFTDGAPAEVVVEAPVVVSDVETEEVVGAEPLLGDTQGAVEGPTNIKFHYKNNKVVVTYDLKVNGGTTVAGKTDLEVKAVEGTTKEADCENPERSIYFFTYNGTDYRSDTVTNGIESDCTAYWSDSSAPGYIANPDPKKGPKGHIWSGDTDEQYMPHKVVTPSTCTVKGDGLIYPGCMRCKKYAPTENDLKNNTNNCVKAENVTAGMSGVKSEKLPLEDHKYSETPVNVTEDYAISNNILQYRPVNCSYENGKFVTGRRAYYDSNGDGRIDPATDSYYMTDDETLNAYYYIAYECSVCHAPGKFQIQWLRDVDGSDNYIRYEEGYNVAGFALFDPDQGELVSYLFEDHPMIRSTDISSPDPVRPILTYCSEPGYYYVREYHKGDNKFVSSKKVEVPAGHTWGSVKADLDNEKTEKDKLLYEDPDTKTIPVVTKDALGNVTEVKSKDCVTKAKYALKHTCLSCEVTESYGDVKEAPFNLDAHQYGPWGEVADPDETTYTDSKDGTYHIKHLNISQTCYLCKNKKIRPLEDVKEKHTLNDKKIEGTQVDATCGVPGSYQSALTCACGYIDEESVTDVILPATDKHDFGTNEAFIEWIGEAYIDGTGTKPAKRQFEARVVRKCNVCGLTDSNGVNGEVVNDRNGGTPVSIKVDYKSVVDAKKDPSTGLTYPCSTAHATIYVDWVGIVDGKAVKLSEKKENVPYYASLAEYQGRTAHQAGELKVENKVAATAEKEGSYDNVIYCRVCGDEMSRETVTVPKLDPEVQVTIPTVTATAVNYNTVNVSWTPVEGATSYRLYYRSADLGITTWHRVRTLKGTSFTHSGLTTGARYRYTVRAEVNGKLGDYSKTGSVARPLPAAPEMKSVTAVSNGTKVTWSKVDGADGYIIFRKTTGAFTRVGAVSKGSKVTWTDRKPVSGATYKVRAYRTVNNVNYKGAFSAAK